jgi:hypothetical protein
MLVEPRPPHRGDAVARLQQRPHPPARTAAHQPQMPAMPARQQFDDGGRFAMPPHAQHDAFVGPFHGRSLQEIADRRTDLTAVIPGRIEDANLRCALHIGESRDSGLDASHRPGMTESLTR